MADPNQNQNQKPNDGMKSYICKNVVTSANPEISKDPNVSPRCMHNPPGSQIRLTDADAAPLLKRGAVERLDF